MVKTRRGVAVNTNEITMEDKASEESSGEDDGPEEVTFETAREDAEKKRRDVAALIKRDKEQQKEKRRKRQELFSEQKKQKFISEEVLKEVESSEASKTNDNPNSEEQEDDEGPESEDEDLEVHEAPVRYNAVRLADHTQADSQQESAKDFIRTRLYGRSSRTTNNQMLSLKNKKAIQKSAAVKFINQDWGLEEKRKAEKFKRRWIQKTTKTQS